ncbi:hypothetical protein HELRODRAFT_178196 [Helobdella robusta]|uniref:Uncharacterized protein n=1 Tax=Helobdella robusta TaxID=6412 RepID=T1FCX3_HELRO|nr:hypothetical protein HELRODRAFT_178196 [Helobdella robusta]ESN97404.1 hypothetical protein HELRODRAFT_178196 [Helobdella robusta]
MTILIYAAHRKIILISPNIFNSSKSNDILTNRDNNLIPCCCGKSCKGRKGLKLHQRSCEMFKNLKNALEIPEESDKNLELSPPPQREQASLERLDRTSWKLIGIKLPKILKQWTEANTYFRLRRASLPNVFDIINFTTLFQSLIYNYVASNYGTVKPQDLSTTQHLNKTVKNMKDLKQLKLLGRNDHSFDMKISTLSKQIRTKLLSMKNAKH